MLRWHSVAFKHALAATAASRTSGTIYNVNPALHLYARLLSQGGGSRKDGSHNAGDGSATATTAAPGSIADGPEALPLTADAAAAAAAAADDRFWGLQEQVDAYREALSSPTPQIDVNLIRPAEMIEGLAARRGPGDVEQACSIYNDCLEWGMGDTLSDVTVRATFRVQCVQCLHRLQRMQAGRRAGGCRCAVDCTWACFPVASTSTPDYATIYFHA